MQNVNVTCIWKLGIQDILRQTPLTEYVTFIIGRPSRIQRYRINIAAYLLPKNSVRDNAISGVPRLIDYITFIIGESRIQLPKTACGECVQL